MSQKSVSIAGSETLSSAADRESPWNPPPRLRASPFRRIPARCAIAELRKAGVTIRLPDQPFPPSPCLLMERAGEVVTREELRDTLWAADTFVDFDTGLNSIVRKLRDTLGDSADHPEFIETLPRRGYRFIASVTPATPDRIPQPDARAATTAGCVRDGRRGLPAGWWLAAAIGTARPCPRTWMVGPGACRCCTDRRWIARRSAIRAPHERLIPQPTTLYMKGVAAAGVLTYEGHRNASPISRMLSQSSRTLRWPMRASDPRSCSSCTWVRCRRVRRCRKRRRPRARRSSSTTRFRWRIKRSRRSCTLTTGRWEDAEKEAAARAGAREEPGRAFDDGAHPEWAVRAGHCSSRARPSDWIRCRSQPPSTSRPPSARRDSTIARSRNTGMPSRSPRAGRADTSSSA